MTNRSTRPTRWALACFLLAGAGSCVQGDREPQTAPAAGNYAALTEGCEPPKAENPDAMTPVEPPDACSVCQGAAVAAGLCDPQIGCGNIADEADRALCVAMLDCMVTQKCAANDPFDCFCGGAVGADCLTAAEGLCVTETLAATRTTDFTEAATRFYDFAFPAGFATQEVACRRDACGATAEPPHTSACPLN